MPNNIVRVLGKLSLILLIFVFGCSTNSKVNVQKDVSSKMEQKSPNIENKKGDIETEDLYKVYDIKGISTNLTAKDKQSIGHWKTEISQIAQNNQDTVYINGNSSEKLVALTFDDGPDPKITPKIVNILNQYGVKGNFFFVGENVKRFPEVVKKTYEDHNLVLNHSYHHPEFTNQTVQFIQNEIKSTGQIIKNIIGKEPAIVRPPYGIVNNNVLEVAKLENLKLILWSTDTFDWSQKDTKNITDNVLNNVRPGEIILMHSNGDKVATAEALPAIIEGLGQRGYTIVTLDLLLKTKAYR